MFNFRGRAASNLDNDFIREANLQIELMHSEMENWRRKASQLEEENTKLRYELGQATAKHQTLEAERKQLSQRLDLLVQAFEPLDNLHKSLHAARKELNLSDFNKITENKE